MSILNEDDVALLEKGVFWITGSIGKKSLEKTYASLAFLEVTGIPDIEIRLTTPGGDVGDGLDMYDAINRYPGKTTGVVYGHASSMGAIILQACDERVALKYATVLIHHISRQSVSLDKLTSKKRWKKLRDSMLKIQRDQYAILANRTGFSIKKIRIACAKNIHMNAEEALAFKLIDRIEHIDKSGK